MAQADRQRFITKVALFLGGLLTFGFVLQELNRLSSPERERWSLVPGPGVTLRIDHPADVFRQLELTDGSLELPARWLQIIPSPGYLITNTILQSLSTELLIDPRHPLELGYRNSDSGERLRFVVLSTKNSDIASANLAKIMKSDSAKSHEAQLTLGPLKGHHIVWKSGFNQIAVVVGSTKSEVLSLLDQVQAINRQREKGIQLTYRGPVNKVLVKSIDLQLTFEDLALSLKGKATGEAMLPAPSIDKKRVLLAVRSGLRPQPIWVLKREDGSWCQRGLTPLWQKAIGANQECIDDPPPGTYVYLSQRLFSQFDLPWMRAEVRSEQRDQTLLISGRAVAKTTPRFFPLYKVLRSIWSKADDE